MTALATAPAPREVALLKAVGLDRLSPEQRELALHIADRYQLDLMMKHLVMIEGRPYVTRDGLLHIAHRSGQLDGIETTEPEIVGEFWRATCSVYRKDMTRPFTYGGRYPTKGGNQKFAPEMAIKVAEVMALRRAFDVAAPTIEERWDIEVPAEPPPPKPTLAERAAEKRAALEAAQASVETGGEALFIDQAAEPVEEPAPAGLTKRQFVDALAANNVPSEYAMSVRGEMFPDTTVELTDAERKQLLDMLLADVTPEAESAPLFTEGEWAPAETTTA